MTKKPKQQGALFMLAMEIATVRKTEIKTSELNKILVGVPIMISYRNDQEQSRGGPRSK